MQRNPNGGEKEDVKVLQILSNKNGNTEICQSQSISKKIKRTKFIWKRHSLIFIRAVNLHRSNKTQMAQSQNIY